MTDDRYRVLMTCGVFEPGFRGGGPVRSLAQILDTLPGDIDAVLITSDRDLGTSEPYPGLSGRWITRGRTSVYYLNTRAPLQWLRLWQDLRTVTFDLMYVNSFFSPRFTLAPILAAHLRLVRPRRLLIAPRGEFARGALALKAAKKQLFLLLWGRLVKRAGVLWHASTSREADDIRAVYPWADVEISLNQVALPGEPMTARPGGRTARLAYIGRISPMKNLDLTLEALGALSAPVRFDIYGPVEDGPYWNRCRQMIDRLGDNVVVRYCGLLAPDEVRSTFAGYDAFVFPTRGENFGHVIAESLSASCPVICSDATSWSAVLRAGGGVVLREGTVAELSAELHRVATMTSDQRLQARETAGAAYRAWHAGNNDRNVLDLIRERTASCAASPA
ncbi:glycosyltransferase family 4 protein [Winogradskya humida]|uniref:Glycosyl transferase family 1 domain-containing protein n=1 Tax=Winogradskya humida TaxID=113566 RepID=A0ABQ3ZXX3_9ACTN|nr:glycosyltransferase family 4 protein [Actinoplanes humidus]GIE23434.1 hypothetical protein Ahu01nite_065360 [Actinoplanes humidus]